MAGILLRSTFNNPFALPMMVHMGYDSWFLKWLSLPPKLPDQVKISKGLSICQWTTWVQQAGAAQIFLKLVTTVLKQMAQEVVEIVDGNLEQKPEEELFVFVDDNLDNDFVTDHAHAVAFYCVDPQLEQTPSVAAETSSQPLTASKMSAADDNAAKKTEVRSVDD